MKELTVMPDACLSDILLHIDSSLKAHGVVSILGLSPDKSSVSAFLENFGSIYRQYGNNTVWDVVPRVIGADTSVGNEYIPLHTEMNEFLIPPDYVALFCVRNSYDGGLLKLVDSHKLIRMLTETELKKLEDAVLKFRVKKSIEQTYGRIEQEAPILSFNESNESTVRFSRNAEVVSGREVVSWFSGKIESLTITLNRQMKPNELLIWDNTRMLHGRSKFTDRDRLLWRICLSKFTAA
jgi:alpha-ketoglutarate-dependent taurine dioxygenase